MRKLVLIAAPIMFVVLVIGVGAALAAKTLF